MMDISKTTEVVEPDYQKKMKVVFPKDKEELIDFLNQHKLKDSEVMHSPCCSAVFDKEATQELEKTNNEHLNIVGR